MGPPESEDQVRIATRLIHAFNRRSIEEAQDLCAPDVELLTLFGRVQGAQRGGHEGLREWFEHIEDAWAFLEAKVRKGETHGDWVIANGHTRGRGKASSREVEFEWTAVVRVANGRVTRLGIYLAREEALRAIEAD